jgi:peptidoglycan hydrolase-like protein with peptidoglycan-binding domain
MKALRVLLLAVLAICLLTVTAYGAGVAVRHGGWPSVSHERGGIALTPATPDPQAAPASTSPSPTPVAPPAQELEPASTIAEVEDVLVPGDRGERVRELQSRLHQLAWFPELTTGTYDAATRGAVRGFQAKRGLEATGRVDPRTWRRLGTMTRTPTHDELHNVLHPGPALLASGARGEDVRDLQARLVATSWLSGDVSGTYDATTVAAVRGFQAKRRIPVTGEVDARTLERLHAMTATPSYEQKHGERPGSTATTTAALDPRCTTGRALCVDKSTNSLRWVVDGRVLSTYDVRFGSDELPTREGAFSVYRKSRDHVSNLFGTSMPFAMFFSGGQAVHYSPDFAAHGYDGASHGCVNVRDYDGVAALFDQVRVGDKVIVYRS